MRAAFFILLFNLIPTSIILGCGCSRPEFTHHAYDSYDLIFIGKLIDNEINYKEEYQVLAFEVIEVLKGQTTKIVTGRNTENTCSPVYNLGEEWIIYSNPKYGLVNDQWLCGHSTLVTSFDGISVAGTEEHYPTKEAWAKELIFLRERKTPQDKIVTFQWVRLIPFIQHASIIILFVFSIIASDKIKLYSPSILPTCLITGILGAVFLYFILLPQRLDYRIPLVMIILISFILLANILYLRWYEGRLTYIKSLILSHITYLLMIGVCIPLVVLNKSPNDQGLFQWGVGIFIRDILIFIGLGLPFSGLLALLFSEKFRIFSGKKGI